jgi:glucose-6-phosphate isomerase
MKLSISPTTSEALAETVDLLIKNHVASRIASLDHDLWGEAAAQEAAIRLGWVSAARESVDLVAPLLLLREEFLARAIDRVVLCGMGGSSLAPEVIAKNYGLPLLILDSTSPDAVASALNDLERTVVVVSSKSGSTVETDSQKRAFESAFVSAGISPQERIVIVTDPGSPLDQSARADGYRVFNADPNVGGRYSALTAFGVVPTALAGADVPELLRSAQQVSARLATDSTDNPALWLAALLGASPSLNGPGHRDKFLLETDALPGFADWAEQLVAESTGKQGRGSLPVVVNSQSPELNLELSDTISLRFGDDEATGNTSFFSGDLGELFLLWQHATAALGWILKINPFDQPDVESAKVAARAMLESMGSKRTPDYVDGGIAINAHGFEHRGRTLDSAIEALLAKVAQDGYLGIHCYANRLEFSGFEELREITAARLRRPVSFGWGPRFLHSTGQYHKGGPSQGVFLQLLVGTEFDLEVPGREFSFGQLIAAQAAGDAAVLAERGLPVLMIELSDPFANFERLKRAIADG